MMFWSWLPLTSRFRLRKGLARSLCLLKEASMASGSLSSVLDLPPLSVLCCSRLNTISIWFSQLAEVGVNPWYNIRCGSCYLIIATIQIVPDDKPVEPSAAVTDTPVQP